MVAINNSDQDEFCQCIRQNVDGADRLVNATKLAAAALTSEYKQVQVVLLSSAKETMETLNLMIELSANPEKISTSAKAVILAIMAMLRTVRDIEEEFSRGLRTFNDIIEELEIFLINSLTLENIDEAASISDPQELLNCIRRFSSATSKTLAVGRNPKNETLLQCADDSQHWIKTLIKILRGTAAASEDPDVRLEFVEAGQLTCSAYLELCKKVVNIAACEDKSQVPIMKQNLNEYSQQVAHGVKSLVQLVEKLRGEEYIDPNDPNNIAEIELRSAAAKIEAAAAKLAQLQPRVRPSDEEAWDASDMTFDEIILEAARSIAGATTALVKSASVAQRELIYQGRLNLTSNETRYHDGQWTDGLISAAQKVAGATGTLCEAANETVQGNAAEERLIVSANQVSASTTQLVLACQVKADMDSKAFLGLKSASQDVKRATQHLVESAQHALDVQRQDRENESQKRATSSFVGGAHEDFKEELRIKEEIERSRKEMEAHEKRLKEMMRARYTRQQKEEEEQQESNQLQYKRATGQRK